MSEIIPGVIAEIERRHAEWTNGEIKVGAWRFVRADYAIEHARAGWDFCLHRIDTNQDILQHMESLSHKRWMTPQAMSDFWHLCSRIGLFPKGVDARIVIEAKQWAKELRGINHDV